MTKYNGWKNYETWNAALWIDNDEEFYSLATEFDNYEDYIYSLRQLHGDHTPDGVAWNDPTIDREALNRVIKEINQ